MKRISARSRIAMGQVALLASVMMLGIALGLMPSPREAILDGRAKLCETIAIVSSVLGAGGGTTGMQAALAAVMSRDHEIDSVGVRQSDGTLVAVVGNHVDAWANRRQSSAG